MSRSLKPQLTPWHQLPTLTSLPSDIGADSRPALGRLGGSQDVNLQFQLQPHFLVGASAVNSGPVSRASLRLLVQGSVHRW